MSFGVVGFGDFVFWFLRVRVLGLGFLGSLRPVWFVVSGLVGILWVFGVNCGVCGSLTF